MIYLSLSLSLFSPSFSLSFFLFLFLLFLFFLPVFAVSQICWLPVFYDFMRRPYFTEILICRLVKIYWSTPPMMKVTLSVFKIIWFTGLWRVRVWNHISFNSGILRDKTIEDKLIYIPNCDNIIDYIKCLSQRIIYNNLKPRVPL